MNALEAKYNSFLSNRSLAVYSFVAILIILVLAVLIRSRLDSSPKVDPIASCVATCKPACTLETEEECNFSCEQSCKAAAEQKRLLEASDPRHPNSTKPISEKAPNFTEAAAASRFINYYLDDLDCQQLLTNEQILGMFTEGTTADNIGVSKISLSPQEYISFIENNEEFGYTVNPGKLCVYETESQKLAVAFYSNTDIDDQNNYQTFTIKQLAQNYIQSKNVSINESEGIAIGKNILPALHCQAVILDRFSSLKYTVITFTGVSDDTDCQREYQDKFLAVKNALDTSLSNLLTNTESWNKFNLQ